MPYKRERSPYYYVRRRSLPGYGDTGRLSSKVTSKKLARDMERLLDEIAQRALVDPTWYELLDAVCRERTITLPELLRARRTGALDGLKRSLHDPLLAEAVEAFLTASEQKREIKIGLKHLLHYADEAYGPAARLSMLDGRTITALCRRAEQPTKERPQGRKRNSVRRYMHRATSLLLRYHLGRAERDRIFADVDFPAEDDTREVRLSPEEIQRLIRAADEMGYHELGVVIRLALQTSADRGVLLAGGHGSRRHRGLLVRDLRIYQDHQSGAFSGEVHLLDRKTGHRSRSVPLTDALCRELLALCKAKGPDDPVFSISYQAPDFLWKRVREAADLRHVRFKDLRAQISIYGEEAGVPLTVLARTMGHGDEAMTRRYQQRATVLSVAQAEAIERAMHGGTASPPPAEPVRRVG